jgi:GAF domain-containing protein
VTSSSEPKGKVEPPSAVTSDDDRQQNARLRELLTVAEEAIQALRNRCEDLEEYRAHLGRLCVASTQLHESDELADCLRNLQDVVVNLIGSEQIAIWSLSADGCYLELRASQGIEPERWWTVKVGEGMVGRSAASGEISVPGPEAGGEPALCIPLMLGRRVVGAVAVFHLLPHRSGFGPLDQDVFRLISRQAAFALCCAGGPWRAARRVGDG